MQEQLADFMKALMEFEANVVQHEFVQIFGSEKAFELWDLFKLRCSSSTTIFYRMIDSKDQKKLNQHIAQYYKAIQSEKE